LAVLAATEAVFPLAARLVVAVPFATGASAACFAAGLGAALAAGRAGVLAAAAGVVTARERDVPSLAAGGTFPDAFATDLADALAAVLVVALAVGGLVGSARLVLEDFWAPTGSTCADAFAAMGAAAFFGVTTLAVVARTRASVAVVAFFDDSPLGESPVVLATADFADAFEAFAFKTAPFLLSAATTVVATICLSCRGEGDRR
jgi:hypothetical protein